MKEKTITILYGNDKDRLNHKLQALKNTLKKKYQIENILTLDAENKEEDLFGEMDSFSIFEDRKMIIVENATFLSSKNSTSYKLEDIVKRLDCEHILIYCCPTEKLDSRKKLVKTMMEHSNVYACLSLDKNSKSGFISELSKKYNVSFDNDAYTYFCSIVGMNSMHIESEIEKLSIYGSHISLKDVEALISPEPEQDIFKMTNAYFDRNALLLMAYYRNFRNQDMEPVAIVALLAGQIRFLYQVSVLMDEGYSKDEITRELKAHPYRIQISMNNARKFTSDILLSHLEELANFDQNMKMGKVDKDIGFEQFILKMLIES